MIVKEEARQLARPVGFPRGLFPPRAWGALVSRICFTDHQVADHHSTQLSPQLWGHTPREPAGPSGGACSLRKLWGAVLSLPSLVSAGCLCASTCDPNLPAAIRAPLRPWPPCCLLEGPGMTWGPPKVCGNLLIIGSLVCATPLSLLPCQVPYSQGRGIRTRTRLGIIKA